MTSLQSPNRTFGTQDTAALDEGDASISEASGEAPPETGRPARTGRRRRGPVTRRGPDAGARYARAQLERGLADQSPTLPTGVVDPGQLGPVPQQGGETAAAPGAGGKGALFTEQAGAAAQNIIGSVKPPATGHVHAAHKDRIRQGLDRLGLLGPGTGRIHIDDVDVEHGGAVLRTAAGPTSLAEGATSTLHTMGPPPDLVAERRSPEQAARLGDIEVRARAAARGELGSDEIIGLMGDRLEASLLRHGDAVAHVRSQLPEDGKDTFMNMSWGLGPEEVLMQGTMGMLTAPPGSAAHDEVTEILGHAPTPAQEVDGRMQLKTEEVAKVRAHLEGKLDTVLGSDEHQARMATARQAFETELAEGREQGLLVFASAGNDAGSADHFGRPDLARNTSSGAEGLILVGATHIHDAPGTDDDRMAAFSNGGDVTLSVAGTQIPVGTRPIQGNPFAGLFGAAPGGPGGAPGTPPGGAPFAVPEAPDPVDVDGTSFSAPAAVEAAYLADQIDPSLGVDDIETLLTDPRVLHDIPGTTRDGAGQLDPFAVGLLAANPDLTRADIDAARTLMMGDPSDAQVAALRARLGLD